MVLLWVRIRKRLKKFVEKIENSNVKVLTVLYEKCRMKYMFYV